MYDHVDLKPLTVCGDRVLDENQEGDRTNVNATYKALPSHSQGDSS